MLTHRALVHEYMSCIAALDLSARDVPLHALPLYHSAQMHVFLMPSLAVGATNHLVEAPDIDVIFDRVARDRVDARCSSRRRCGLAWPATRGWPSADLSAVCRRAYYGASIMPVPVLQGLQARLPGVGFYNCFGQSEIGPLATVLRPEEHAASARTRWGARCSSSRRASSMQDMNDVAPGARRGRLPLAAAVHRLLGRARGDRGGLPWRLVSLRRPRPHRRGGLHVRRRPDQGRDQHRRRARCLARGRGRRSTRTRRSPRWRSSACRTSAGSRRSPRSWSCARTVEPEELIAYAQRAPRGPQGPQERCMSSTTCPRTRPASCSSASCGCASAAPSRPSGAAEPSVVPSRDMPPADADHPAPHGAPTDAAANERRTAGSAMHQPRFRVNASGPLSQHASSGARSRRTRVAGDCYEVGAVRSRAATPWSVRVP